MNVTFSRNSGCSSRNWSNAAKPRRTFFDRSARSTRRMMWSRRRRLSSSSNCSVRSLPGDLARRLVVDRQRVGAHPHLAPVVLHDAALEVDLQPHEVAAALQEVPAVGARVEADDVVGQHALVDLVADALGQHAPGVGLRPRDVDEVVQEDVGARLADDRRQRVEVVVVDHDDRLVLALDLLDDGSREVLVDDLVAVVEGVDLVLAHVGRVGEIPQVVLDEPQHRVGDDVVEAVVGLGVARRRAARGRRCRRSS